MKNEGSAKAADPSSWSGDAVMKIDKTLVVATISTGVSVAVLLVLDLDRAVSNLSWYSLAFWIPVSVIIFWITILVGGIIDPLARKHICDPLIKLIDR